MSSQNFIFPPPPPPPPQQSSFQSYSTGPQPPYRQGYGFQGSNGYGSRVRGRGGGFGGSRGGSNHNGQRQPNNGHSTADNHGGQGNNFAGGSYPLPNYPPIQQQQQYPAQSQGGYGYRAVSGYAGGIQASLMSGPMNNPPVAMGPPIRIGFGNNGAPSQPVPPPIQLQNDLPQPNNTSVNGYQHQQGPYGNHRQPYNRPHGNSSGHRGQKRLHGDAFGSSHNQKPQTLAPPAIPSFGLALPIKPPQPTTEIEKKPNKKKRKHNQLGLTPQGEDHESTEEEEDVDEEAKLAAVHGVAPNQSQVLQFSYKGRTATLNSPSDIVAWIAERKRRFPTKARIEEAAERKRKAQEEARLAKQQRKDEYQRKKEEEQARRIEIEKKKSAQDKPSKILDKETKAELKAEKLRKMFEKAQRKVDKLKAKKAVKEEEQPQAPKIESGSRVEVEKSIAKSEEEADGLKHKKAQSPEGSFIPHYKQEPKSRTSVEVTSGIQNPPPANETIPNLELTPVPLTPESQPSPLPPTSEIEAPTDDLSIVKIILESIGVPDMSSTISLDDGGTSNDSSDLTSDTSSDELSSDEVHDLSIDTPSSDSAPEENSSKSAAPEFVIPAKPAEKKAICRNFLARGRCARGEQCQYRHELPERGQGTANAAKEKKRKGKRQEYSEKRERMTLYQRMVLQEKAKEDELILQHIVFLGENKALE